MSVASAPALVTGASGFIGRHLVSALLASGREVIALCRPSSALPSDWNKAVERIDCVDWSVDGLAEAIGGRRFERVFHLAAYGVVPADRDPATMFRINARLPTDMVTLCKRNGAAMVMAGSSAEYRQPEGRQALNEQSPLELEKSYGASKAQGTTQACKLADEIGVPLRVLRLFNVYGPGEAPHRLLPSLVSGLAGSQRIALSEGSQVRDFVYVGDVVEAMLAAVDQMESRPGSPASVWNVATGEGRTVREFAQTTARLMGRGEQQLGFGDLPMRPDEIDYLVGNCALIRSQTGWAARHDLASGIAASLAQTTGSLSNARAAQ